MYIDTTLLTCGHSMEKGGRWRPVRLLTVGWLVSILALAGPTWQMQPSPFTEDLAAMVIILKVTPEMLARDIQPSRLQRGVQKIHDLLELKKGVRTALIAYAGSAHLVMPLTSDAGVINDFAAALEPGIMPVAGDEPAEAITLANQRLSQANTAGSIILITDHVDVSYLQELATIHEQGGVDVHILAIAGGADVIPPPGSPPAPPVDADSLSSAADVMGGSLVMISADKSDVRHLSTLVERSISRAPPQEGQQWEDAGYLLVVVIMLIMLFFFRHGGSVALE